MKKLISVLYVASGMLPVTTVAQESAGQRPNFIWFMTEDVSMHYLSLFNGGREGVSTPNVELLAQEGFVFTNAYCNAPVSSPARSTLITGCYATRLGADLHRGLTYVPLPENLNMFPAYLRNAGYYTSNSTKTDYNFQLDKSAWNQISAKMGGWRNRPDKSKPFFHVRTSFSTHEGKLHFGKNDQKEVKTNYDPANVKVHPYHPDTELFRYTYARFYDCIQESDAELGQLMSMLKEDGELDNTFVFYFGDNGGSLPGTKGYTGETGLHVPLVVYVPKNWRHLLPDKIGQTIDGFVSFVDFAPTLLHLAGVEIPEEMDGTPFLGEDISLAQLNARNEAYGYGDRFDELYAFNRTVRKANFKYSRNFQPYHSKSLFAVYRYKQAAFAEWEELYDAGKLNSVQSRFFEPQTPEELYDLSTDPYETNNLAADKKYRTKLLEMRGLLKQKLMGDRDLGFYPECVWLEQGAANPVAFTASNSTKISRYSDVADLQMRTFKEAESEIRKALKSTDPVERYWGATVCASFGEKARKLVGDIKPLLDDPEPFVRSRVIVFLAQNKKLEPSAAMNQTLALVKSPAEALQVLNDITYLRDGGLGYQFEITEVPKAARRDVVESRIKHINQK